MKARHTLRFRLLLAINTAMAALLLVSDGVAEAFSPRNEPFGRGRLAALFSDCRTASIAQTLRRIEDAVAAHRGGAAPDDDTTLVVIEFVAEEPCAQGHSLQTAR